MLYYLGKTKKVGYPASPQANAKRFDIEAFAQMLRVFGCGCCRHPHFLSCNGGALPSAN